MDGQTAMILILVLTCSKKKWSLIHYFYEDDEVSFARHGPVVEPDQENIASQRGF